MIVAIVTTGDTWVTVMIPKMDPSSLQRALRAAASVHPWSAVSALSGEKSGGLSGATELGTMFEVDRAANLAADSLQEDGYQVALLVI